MKELDKLSYLIKRLNLLRKKSDLKPIDLLFMNRLIIETESFSEKNRPGINKENAEDMFNPPYEETYIDHEFCQACQERPFMCSDREKTSTIHDF